MSTQRKKPAKPQPSASVIDVDALIAAAGPPATGVILRFRGEEWSFKPLTEAPLSLFDDGLDQATSFLLFVQTLLNDGQVFPTDVTVREAEKVLNAYTSAAVGLTAGK